jgi:predicted amidohydrolase
VFDMPVGRVAVLVCADAWYPASYEALAGRDVEVVAVPILVSPAGKWTEAWGGYSGHPAPDDVDLEDIGALTEQEAWQRYGAQGRAKAMGAPVALTVPMRGAIWDLDTDGAAHAVRRGETFDAPQREGHAALVLWR